MSLISFVPNDGYPNPTGTVNIGGGDIFNVGAALAAQGGVITVDTHTDQRLADALDKYPGLKRSGVTTSPTPIPDTVRQMLGHTEPETPGFIPVLTSEGYYLPTDPATLNTGSGAGATLKSTQQAGAAYSFVAADNKTVVEGTSATNQTFTIPPGIITHNPLDNALIEVFQYGLGRITIAGPAISLVSDGGKFTTAGQFATLGLRQRAQNEWVVSGDVA